jgi:hypothetical protein
MTKKENLYFELLKIKDEVSMKKYNSYFKLMSAEEFANTPKFRKEADYHTVAQIEEEMKIWQKQLDEINEKEAVKNWLETDEGKAYIKERQDRIEGYYAEARKLMDEARIHVSKVIKELLGDEWDVTRLSDGNMEIAIVEKYTEDGRPVGLFGHEFEISYGHDWTFHKGESKVFYRWEMNYGTMGTFKLDGDNNTRARHLIGMGKFAADTTVVPELKEYLQTMAKTIYDNEKIVWKLEKEIKEPKMVA